MNTIGEISRSIVAQGWKRSSYLGRSKGVRMQLAKKPRSILKADELPWLSILNDSINGFFPTFGENGCSGQFAQQEF